MAFEDFISTALADRTNDIILVTDAARIDAPHGPKIVYCNPAFERVTGWSRADAIGRTPRILQTSETDRRSLNVVRGALERWLAGDETAEARVELLNKTQGGAPYWVDLEIVPIWSRDDSGSYWASVQRDVTARVVRETAALEGLSRDDDGGAQVDQLLAKCTHDLRAPFNAILGFADLLLEERYGPLSAKQRRFVGEIAHAGRHGLRLTKDLLDMSALRSGAPLSADCETVEAREVVDFTLSILAGHAAARDVRLTVKGDRAAALHCDPLRARQCLTNIVENAIKFSPRGGAVTVAIAARDDRLAIAVSDEGPGMSADEIEVAKRFYGRVGSGDGPGVGLGLPIAIDLMALQGGGLTIASEPGVGTTATLVFRQPTARVH